MHQVVDGRQRTLWRLAVEETLGQAAKTFVFVLFVNFTDFVCELIRFRVGAVRHEADDVFRVVGDLCGFGTIDRIQGRVILQAVVIIGG